MLSFPFTPLSPPKESSLSSLMARAIELFQKERREEALALFHQVLKQDPKHGRAHMYGAIIGSQLGQKEVTRYHLKESLIHGKNDAQIHYNGGIILGHEGDLLRALEAHKRAALLDPSFADAFNNAGFILWSLGRHQESFEFLTRAIGLNPNHDKAHYSRAEILLLWGDLEVGFKEYEWRWQHELMPPRSFEKPLWEGQPLQGKTLLLYEVDNFGHGDQLHFIRYAGLLKEMGAQVMVECSPEILPLFQEVPFIDVVFSRGGNTLPFYDYRLPFLSLPCAFKTNLTTIPFSSSYIQAPSLQIPLPPHPQVPSPRLRVGLVWAGNPGHLNDKLRSMPLAALSPLFQHQDIAFYSVQHGEAASQIHKEGWTGKIVDLSPALVDFKATASLISQMDLVITVDTAVAHLCGSMGKPVWIFLCHPPEWRWLLDRSDSPWYKSARLFRQSTIGDWKGPVNKVCALLSQSPIGTG
jgi:Flp pilus assembly protein TadD